MHYRLPFQRFPAFLALAVLMASSAHADNAIDGHNDLDPGGTAYSVDDMVARVGDLFGPDRAAQIDSLRNDPTDPVDIGEMDADENWWAAHDRDTIGLNTKTTNEATGEESTTLTLTEAAVSLEHEAAHVESARAANEQNDPRTRDLSCGHYRHATMHYAQITQAISQYCETAILDPDEWKELCRAMINANQAGDGWMRRAAAENQACRYTSPSTVQTAREAQENAKQAIIDCCI